MSRSYEVGDWVEVRPKEEILSTLDEEGCLDSMPFMPEMLKFCGNRYRVSRRAHKTCDTVHKTGGRRVEDCVHLEGLRCDGAAHGGCDAACFIFWKTAWIRPVEGPEREPSRGVHAHGENNGLNEEDLDGTTHSADGKTYRCQATELPKATEPLQWWEPSQYVEDYRSGNVGLWRLIRDPLYFLYCRMATKRIVGRVLRWINNRFRFLFGGIPYPLARGRIPVGEHTPVAELNLQPGELVRVKSFEEIRATLDEANKNRGLYFDKEQVPYCGGTYRVRHRVDRIINEKTGEMMEMKTPSVILEGVSCSSRFSECRLFCPRAIYSMWREIWLERVDPSEVTNEDVPVLDQEEV